MVCIRQARIDSQTNFDDEASDINHGFEKCSPSGIGDPKYPLRESLVEPLQRAHEVRERSGKWRDLTGELVGALETLEEIPPPPPSCNEEFGIGRCRLKLPVGLPERFSACIAECNRLASIARSATDLPVFLFSDGTSHISVLSVFALLMDPKAHLFFRVQTTDGRVPTPGSILDIALLGPPEFDNLNFLPEVELAFLVARDFRAYTVRQILYTPIVGPRSTDGRLPLVLRVDKVAIQINRQGMRADSQDTHSQLNNTKLRHGHALDAHCSSHLASAESKYLLNVSVY